MDGAQKNTKIRARWNADGSYNLKKSFLQIVEIKKDNVEIEIMSVVKENFKFVIIDILRHVGSRMTRWCSLTQIQLPQHSKNWETSRKWRLIPKTKSIQKRINIVQSIFWTSTTKNEIIFFEIDIFWIIKLHS